MKPLIFLILMTFCSCIKTQTECNCKDFRTGNFEFSQTIKGKKMVSTFTRNENLQIEKYNGKIDSATVRWTNECEFVLQKINPKNMQEQKAITMRIIATTAKGYTFDYSFVGENQKQVGTVSKI